MKIYNWIKNNPLLAAGLLLLAYILPASIVAFTNFFNKVGESLGGRAFARIFGQIYSLFLKIYAASPYLWSAFWSALAYFLTPVWVWVFVTAWTAMDEYKFSKASGSNIGYQG